MIEEKRKILLEKERRLDETRRQQFATDPTGSDLSSQIQDRQRKRNERVLDRTKYILDSHRKKEEAYDAMVRGKKINTCICIS